MLDAEILIPLKVDLGISKPTLDQFLLGQIASAKQRISDEGITLRDTVADGMLVEMYAAYLYRIRREPAPMPRALRWALNNRLFAEKGAEENGG